MNQIIIYPTGQAIEEFHWMNSLLILPIWWDVVNCNNPYAQVRAMNKRYKHIVYIGEV